MTDIHKATKELKPCPFCGGEADLFAKDTVSCSNSECSVHHIGISVRTWNTRALESAVGGTVEHLDTDRLVNAVKAVYYAAHWTPDRPVDAGALWTELRDAAELEPGKSPVPIPTPSLTTRIAAAAEEIRYSLHVMDKMFISVSDKNGDWHYEPKKFESCITAIIRRHLEVK